VYWLFANIVLEGIVVNCTNNAKQVTCNTGIS